MLFKNDFISLLINEFPYLMTQSQEEAIEKLVDFLYKKGERRFFILRGYAGTGKTSLVSALVKTFIQNRRNIILLAPTGRSAKVFSSYANTAAYTIHKVIYSVQNRDGKLIMHRKINQLSNTLFIVDEVSMIAQYQHREDYYPAGNLLEDLVQFVFEGKNNKLIFVGDDAQLAPIHETESKALNLSFMNDYFDLLGEEYTLTDIVRQEEESGILFNANLLRQVIKKEKVEKIRFLCDTYPDFKKVDGVNLEELLHQLYSNYSVDDIIIITRSNWRANLFNQEIRNRILFRESLINGGDLIMAVKNNYFYLSEDHELGFIANGEMMEVQKVVRTEEMHGFQFADLMVQLCDYPDFPPFEIKVILNTLLSTSSALTFEEYNTLYESVSLDYADITSKKERMKLLKEDPYLNAVQIKFSYAVTGHKSQGGEWSVALIDFVLFQDEELTIEHLRWLYTAITRGKKEVYLINFDEI